MRSARTRYTTRCSCVTRLDHVLGAKWRKGSGLPRPENGSRMTASTRASTRSATRRSVSTQYRRSSRNSGWKAASRSALRFVKPDFTPQRAHALWALPAGPGPRQGSQEPLRIARRPQEVGRFTKAAQLGRGHQRHILGAAARDDNDLVVFRCGITQPGKVRPGLRVCRLNRHSPYTKSVQFRHTSQPRPSTSAGGGTPTQFEYAGDEKRAASVLLLFFPGCESTTASGNIVP